MITRRPALTVGACDVSGCPDAWTPTGRVRKRATVLVICFGRFDLRLCPTHARELEVELHRVLLGGKGRTG